MFPLKLQYEFSSGLAGNSQLFHVEQFWVGAMFAILSNLFVGSALLPVISICVGLMLFVHRITRVNPDTQKGIKIGWLVRFLFGKCGFVRVI